MIDLVFLFKCFLVGVVGNLSLGPIFLLTFNRSARYGMSKGFAIAVGASLADALLFFLGLTGALSLLDAFGQAKIVFFLIGFVVLSWLAAHSLLRWE